jgi:hypothetical protein
MQRILDAVRITPKSPTKEITEYADFGEPGDASGRTTI